jgi:hypothetical protein
VTATVVLVTLLLAPAPSSAASAASGPAPAPAACEVFRRSSATMPPEVREWFARSSDERVLVCPQPATPGGEAAAPLYFAEGVLRQHDGVCSYLRHVLTLTGSGAGARLQRYERTEALAMAPFGPDCPLPHPPGGAQGYVETYDVSPAAFVAIMRLWSETCASHAGCGSSQAAAAAKASHGSAAAADAAANVRARLEAALGPDRMSGVRVTRIVRIPGSLLRHRYALFMRVPQTTAGPDSLYVAYLEKRLRGPFELSSFAETN